MKYLSLLLIAVLWLSSCSTPEPQKVELPDNSIFNLTSQWHNQNGEAMQLKDLQGKTLVVVMIFTTCQSACPILVAKMKSIESKISRKDIENIDLVLVTIDPETDTPEKLKEFAKTNKMDAPQWIFLTSNEAATQEFANVLSMKYKKISPIDFSHSNIISVFNPMGELVSQEEGDINVERVVSTVTNVVNNKKKK